MPANVLVIGLDAAEATLIDRWSTEGVLPTFARLREDADAVFELETCLDTLPAAVWREIATSRSCAREGIFFPPRQLKTGETAIRSIRPDEVDSRAFWTAASDAGKRVAALDISDTVLAPDLDGTQLIGWTTHNRNFYFGAQSDPPEFLEEVRTRYGDPPVPNCDAHHADLPGLRAGLLATIEMKRALLVDQLEREQWDLFVCGFSEAHCIGHHFWHLFEDEGSDASPEERTAIKDVYRALDAAVGDVLAAGGGDCAKLVFLSHGMGPPAGGRQLLPEVLVRLGMGSGTGVAAHVRSRLPVGARTMIRRALPGALRRRLQHAAASLPSPLEVAETRAIAVENNRVGAIRLNLKGREPNGSVEPGEEADALIDELRRELLALKQPETGQPIVDRVMTSAEAFGPEAHADTPDLLVVFRRDIGLIEACTSPRVGVVRAPFATPDVPRTGDHTAASRLWAFAPGATAANGHGSSVDIGPTALSLLGVPTPEWMDGRPLLAPAAA